MLPALLTDTITSDLDRALHYTLLWGLEGVELRTVGKGGDRVPFVNEAKLKRRLTEHEMPAVAVVPGMFEGPLQDRTTWMNEIAAFDETLQFCRRIECPRVVVSAFAGASDADTALAADALRRAGDAAGRYGIVVAVLNEVGSAHPTGAALAALLEAAAHPSVQAAWNPAAALQAGEHPRDGLDRLAGRVALVRCSDGRMNGDTWQPTTLGDGAVGWGDQIRRLRQAGFDGPLSLEVVVEPRPKQGLRDTLRLVQFIRTAAR